MNTLLERLDSWCLTKIQNSADRIYNMVGTHNMAMAKALFWVSVVFLSLHQYVTMRLHGLGAAVGLIFELGLCVGTWFLLRKRGENPGDDVLSIAEIYLGKLRLLSLILFFLSLLLGTSMVLFQPTEEPSSTGGNKSPWGHDTEEILHMVFHLIQSLGLHFASCKKPPKKKSWLAEKTENLLESLRPAPPIPQLNTV